MCCKQTDMLSGAVAYVRQQERRGLGHAVWCARRLIGDEPFAVILPDDVIDAETPCLQQMVEAYAETGGNMVATMEVPHENVSSYGILDVGTEAGPTMSVRGMVEKPKAADAPSNFAVIGRYILTPQVLENLQGAGAAPAARCSSPTRSPPRSTRATTCTPSASRAGASTAAPRPAICRRPSPSASPARSCARSSSSSCQAVTAAYAPLPERAVARG